MYHCALVNCRSKMYCNRKNFWAGLTAKQLLAEIVDQFFFYDLLLVCNSLAHDSGLICINSTELLLIICNF